MSDSPMEDSRADVLGALLAKDSTQPREEPQIAANIHEQLQHMGLSTWSLSVLRRLRDAIVRQQPTSLLEVGAGIGHRTAWLLDICERYHRPYQPLTLIEQGGKFGVILQRLLHRYQAMSWSSVLVGDPLQIAAQHQASVLASLAQNELRESQLQVEYDAIIIDGPSSDRARLVETYIGKLSKNGVLYTLEPDAPVGEIREDDSAGMALVDGFNAWIALIRELNSQYHIAFMPLFGGTLVAFLPHAP